MSKKITSRPGLFGTTNHYDSTGKKVGYSRPGAFGTTVHYDADGNRSGRSTPGVFASAVHYDEEGHRIGATYEGPFGQHHYDSDEGYVGSTHDGAFQSKVSCLDDVQYYTHVKTDDGRVRYCVNEDVYDEDDWCEEVMYSEASVDRQNPVGVVVMLLLIATAILMLGLFVSAEAGKIGLVIIFAVLEFIAVLWGILAVKQ